MRKKKGLVAVLTLVSILIIILASVWMAWSSSDKVNVTEPIIMGQTLYDDYALALRMYEGEYRTEYSLGPGFGPNWVGEYELAIIDTLSGEVVYTHLLKEWGEELLFQESVPLTLTDYNMDGVYEVLIGQYGGQNYNTYNMYYVTEDAAIGYYSEIGTLAISSEDMSPQLEVSNGSIQYPLYDNSLNKMNMNYIELDALSGVSACGLKGEQHFTVTEIDAYDFAQTPSQFVLIGVQPCVLVEGEAYLYEGGSWNKIYVDKKLTEIYAGETFCALTEDGEIYVTEDTWAEYEGYPLGSAGVYYNAEKMLQYSSGTKIEQISANIMNDYIIAASADGEIKVYVNGMERGIAEPIRISDMSGSYLLSEEGDVYMVSYPDSFDRVRVNKVSDDRFVSISACPTANRCIGVKQDGSVEVWSDVEGELASDFQDVEKVSMGFHYCVALYGDGEVCFSAYDEELEAEIRAYLEQMDDKVVDVTCAYGRIAIMYEDYSICMIDF